MKHKASKFEPADRPLVVPLSHAEVVILLRYHIKEAKAVLRRYQSAVGSLMLSKPLNFKQQRAINQEAQAQMAAHSERAKALTAILETQKV